MTASAAAITTAKAPAPVSAYMLADHLDAALAAGEDLVAIAHAPENDDPLITTDTIMAARAEQRAVVERIRGLELSLIARILKARERATELARADQRFQMIAKLFTGGTAVIVDAVAECTDATLNDFDTADAAPSYLRSRGLLPADTYALGESATIAVDENFLVANRIALGPLLDMVASFIDALELHFELYADEAGDVRTNTVSDVRAETVGASTLSVDDAEAAAEEESTALRADATAVDEPAEAATVSDETKETTMTEEEAADATAAASALPAVIMRADRRVHGLRLE